MIRTNPLQSTFHTVVGAQAVAKAGTIREADIVGTFSGKARYQGKDIQARIRTRPDHSFSGQVRVMGMNLDFSGRWRFNDGQLEARGKISWVGNATIQVDLSQTSLETLSSQGAMGRVIVDGIATPFLLRKRS